MLFRSVISKGYLPALAQGLKIGAFVHEGLWHDLRTPAFYWAALRDFLEQKDPKDLVGVDACRAARGLKSWRRGTTLGDSSTKLAPSAKLGSHVLIEPGCEIAAKAELDRCLLLPGARVAEGQVVKNAIFGQNLRVDL